MELIAIVTIFLLAQAMYFAIEVGKARGKYNVKAPAISGDVMFERHYRVHQNTLEQLVIFLPSLWLFGLFVSQSIAAGLGVVFFVGRFVFRRAYLADPAGRALGFIIGLLSILACFIGVLVNTIGSLL